MKSSKKLTDLEKLYSITKDKRVLIVDDDTFCLSAVEMLLESAGFKNIVKGFFFGYNSSINFYQRI